MALFQYSVTGDSAYLLAPQRPLMAAQDEDGDTSVADPSLTPSVPLICPFTDLFSPDSGLHLAVLHNQQEALKSLTQVVSALPGQEVLNARNHLYQVLHTESLSRRCTCILCSETGSDLVRKPGVTVKEGC